MFNRFMRRPMHREIMGLAVPAIVEQLLMSLIGVVTTMFVGSLGSQTLAAVGMVNSIVFVLQTVFSGLATGATVIIAHMSGERDYNGMQKALKQTLISALVVALFFVGASYAFSRQMIGMFFRNAEAEVMEIGLKYFRLTFFSLIFMVVDQVITAALRGKGETRLPMYISGFTAVIHVILCSLLIGGLSIGGVRIIPGLGLTGAVASVIIVRFVGAYAKCLAIYKGKSFFTFDGSWLPDIPLIKRITHIGLPAFFEQAVMQGGFLLMQVIISRLGTADLAAYQVGGNLNGLQITISIGFQVTAMALAGRSLGGHRLKLARLYLREVTRLGMFITLPVAAVMLIFSRQLVGLYSSDPETVNAAVRVINIFTLLMPVSFIMIVYAGVLRAAGDIRYVMYSALAGLWTMRIGFTYVGIDFLDMGLNAAMAGIFFDFGVRALMYVQRVRHGKWLTLKI